MCKSPEFGSGLCVLRRGSEGHFLAASLTWRGVNIRWLEEVPVEGKFVILLPVLDYLRLYEDEDGGRLGLLEQEDVVALSSDRALLVLDLSNEGPAFVSFVFDALHANLLDKGIPRRNVAFVSQNDALEENYLAHFGQGIRFWRFGYFIVAAATWMSDASGRRVFGDKAFVPGIYSPLESVSRPAILCQNAAARWHRVLVYRWLMLSGLADLSFVSFYGIGSDNSKGNELSIDTPPIMLEAAFPELLEGIEDWIPRRAQRLDVDKGSGNELVLTIDVESYSRSLLNIVTESDFFVSGIERITEKSIKAAAMGIPFILVGAPGSVQRLRLFGFRAFDDLVDHSYDCIEDPVDRLHSIFSTILQSWRRCSEEPERWRALARPDGVANFEHSRGERLLELIDVSMIHPLVSSMRTYLGSEILKT